MWYLRTDEADMVYNPENTAKAGIVAFLTSYVLYGYLIPISLYVSLEFVKVTQAMIFINGDGEMLAGNGHPRAREDEQPQRRARHGAHRAER